MRSARALAVLAAAALAACQREDPALAPAPEPYVLATFHPLAYFAQRIAGPAVEIVCPLPEGADPATARPSRDAIALYQGARLILVNGAGFEEWLPTVSLPQSRVVDTSAGFRDRFLEFATVTHSHGPGGAHTHEGIDGHVWLDPLNAKLQAKAVADGLSRAFPERAAAFAQGLAALHADLDDLHARLQALAPALAEVRLLASHPAYNYLAARYGWRLTNLDLDPAAVPTDAQVATVREAAAGARRAVLLWEEPPRSEVEARLEEIGVRSVVFAPGENPSPAELQRGEDYLAVQRANVERLAAAVRD